MRKCDSCKKDIGRTVPVFCSDCLAVIHKEFRELEAKLEKEKKRADALKFLWQAAEKEREFIDS